MSEPKRKSKSYRFGDKTVRQLEEICEALHGLAETTAVENAIERYHAEVMNEKGRRRRLYTEAK